MTVVNRLGQEFECVLKGNEYHVPQLPNEDEYFDYVDGIKPFIKNANSLANIKGTYVVPRKSKVRLTEVVIGDKILNAGVIYREISKNILEELCSKIDIYSLYSDSKAGDKARTPPLRKDLFSD